jgi:hypothetical protein
LPLLQHLHLFLDVDQDLSLLFLLQFHLTHQDAVDQLRTPVIVRSDVETVIRINRNWTQLLWRYFPCEALKGIAAKELPTEVTIIIMLSKFTQSEVTLTYCKLLANQKQQFGHVPSRDPMWQLSHVPSRDPKRYVTMWMQSLCATSRSVAQWCVTFCEGHRNVQILKYFKMERYKNKNKQTDSDADLEARMFWAPSRSTSCLK